MTTENLSTTQALLDKISTDYGIDFRQKHSLEMLQLNDTLQTMYVTEITQEIFYRACIHSRGQQIIWNERLWPQHVARDAQLLSLLGVTTDVQNKCSATCTYNLYTKVGKRFMTFEQVFLCVQHMMMMMMLKMYIAGE